MISYQIHRNHSLSVATNVGKTTVEECIGMLAELHQDPDYSANFDALLDYREMTTPFFDADIRQVISAQEHGQKPTKTDSKVAIVVNDDLSFASCRMYEQLYGLGPGDKQVMVFRAMSKALTWLDREGFAACLQGGCRLPPPKA